MLAIRTMHGAFAFIIRMVAIGVAIIVAKAFLCDLFERTNPYFVTRISSKAIFLK